MSVLRGYLPTGRTAEWESGCPSPMAWVGRADGACSVAPLAVGETRMVVLRSDVPEGGPIRLTLEAEGNELAPADNEITIAAAGPEAAPAPAPTPVKTARKQRLRNGIKLKLTGEGATRTTATIKVNTRQVRLTRTVKLTRKRTVTLRATGAKLRSLRRALTRSSSLRVRVVARGRRARRRSRRPA